MVIGKGHGDRYSGAWGQNTWGQGWENKGNAYAHGTDRQTDSEGTEECCDME